MIETSSVLKESHIELLFALLRFNTVSPMETGKESEIPQALDWFIKESESLGGILRMKRFPSEQDILFSMTPTAVREVFSQMGGRFFENQPSAVIEFGDRNVSARTIMFNFHIDTVGEYFEPKKNDEEIRGRGAVDTKGLGVAALAGITDALSRISTEKQPRIILQVVSGEEGGAMGIYGTRTLVDEGYFGKLNVILEPTNNTYMDFCSASMTAQIEVKGSGSTDDKPSDGDNATVILSYIANAFAKKLPEILGILNASMCIGGIKTGDMHNRVYGNGKLLVNFSYSATSVAHQLECIIDELFDHTLKDFQKEYLDNPIFDHSAKNVFHCTQLTWRKKRLPVLDRRDCELERKVIKPAGLDRFGDIFSVADTFTCDAIWLQAVPNGHTIIYGDGDLGRNNAHASDEFIKISEIERTALGVSNLIQRFSQSDDI